MASFLDKIKNWFNKQETKDLQYDVKHQAYADEVNKGDQAKEHMGERIEDVDLKVAEE